MPYTVMSHVTHINEFHDSHVDRPCHTYRWVTLNLWMSHVTHMKESCHTQHTNPTCIRCVWLSHVSHTHEWSHTHVYTRRTDLSTTSCYSVLQRGAVNSVRCSVLQCVAVCCSVMQGAAICCSVLQGVAVCCYELQCAAVYCSVCIPDPQI